MDVALTTRRITLLPENAFREICTLHAYWLEKAAGGAMPHRADFDPFSLKPWLGNICIYEQISGALDFQIRLNGSNIVDLTGEEWTGRRVSEVDRKYGTTLLSDLMETLREGQPIMHEMPVFQRPHCTAIRLLLPLTKQAGLPADLVLMALYSE